MMRFIVSVLATVAISLAATAASATITLSVVGTILTGANAGSTDTTLAASGDQVQIDVFMTNAGEVAGATLSASSADLGGNLTFNTGTTASTWFNDSLGKFGNPQGGIANIRGTVNGFDGPMGSYTSITLPHTLTGADIINGALQLFSGLAANPSFPPTGTGANDLTIKDGGTSPGGTLGFEIGTGGAHARIIIDVLGTGGILDLGQGPNDGLVNTAGDSIVGTSIQIGAVPEPGTALLMGLGLSGLSLAGRRRA